MKHELIPFMHNSIASPRPERFGNAAAYHIREWLVYTHLMERGSPDKSFRRWLVSKVLDRGRTSIAESFGTRVEMGYSCVLQILQTLLSSMESLMADDYQYLHHVTNRSPSRKEMHTTNNDVSERTKSIGNCNV